MYVTDRTVDCTVLYRMSVCGHMSCVCVGVGVCVPCVNHLNRCKTSTLIDGIAFPYQVLCHEYFTRRLSNLLFICRGARPSVTTLPNEAMSLKGKQLGTPSCVPADSF